MQSILVTYCWLEDIFKTEKRTTSSAQPVEILETKLFSFQVSELSEQKYCNEPLLPRSKVASNGLRKILKKHKVEQHVLLGVKKPFTFLKVGRRCSVRALATLKLAALWKKAVILLLWILLLPEPWRGIRRELGTLLIWESGQGKIKEEDINTGWLAHMYLIFKFSEKCCWFVSPCLSSCRVTELLLKWVRKKCYFLALTWHSTLETSVVWGKLNLPCTCCCHMEFRVAFNSGFFSLSYSGPTIST